jgi:hypothetical protein
MALAFYGILDRVQLVLQNFFNPDNPFVPWLLIFDLLVLLVYVYSISWVYRDALYRFGRGAPWATLTALLPLAGWLFYLLYRYSPLVEFDRIEAETFEETEHEWTDYDQRGKLGAAFFAELGAAVRTEGSGYSQHVRLSRLRELTQGATPEVLEQRRRDRVQQRAQAALAKRDKREAQMRSKQERQAALQEKQTFAAHHGGLTQVPVRAQRAMQRKLEVLEKLKSLPREDPRIEELIYQMDYAGAIKAAQDAMAVCQEMNDHQGTLTYEAYLERLAMLMNEEDSGALSGPGEGQ